MENSTREYLDELDYKARQFIERCDRILYQEYRDGTDVIKESYRRVNAK